MKKLKLLIQKILLEIRVLQIQLAIKLLKQKRTVPNLPKPRYIVVHHSGNSHTFYQVNNYHKQRWGFKSSLNFYIGYHKWIAYNGDLFVARRDNEEGAHCVEAGRPHYWNRNSIGICLQGNMQTERPTKPQLERLKRELDKYDIPIKQHKEIFATLCPGKNLSKWLSENY